MEKGKICERCKKNEATIGYTESILSYSHGFVEEICKECYNKMMKNSEWYKQGFENGKRRKK